MTGTGGLPDGSVPHALVDDVTQPRLGTDTAHHLRRVRRLGSGAQITVTDGAGRWRAVRLGGSDGDLEVAGDIHTVERGSNTITVAFALTKGTKPDLVVQKLTELGVDRIVPFVADRSVVRWEEAKAQTQHQRWLAIARGALEQSRGAWTPDVAPLTTFDTVVGPLGATLLDRGGEPLTSHDTVVAVGPEGGWSADEKAAAPRLVGIGDRVMRAETAAIAVGAIVGARIGAT